MPRKKKSNAGRPTVMTEATIQKLEQAFVNDFTDAEACLYADIKPSTLYLYQKNNPEFLEKKELLKNSLSMKAKTEVARKISKGDKDTIKWWLERRRKAEFSTREEVTGANGEPLTVTVTRKTHKAK